MNLGYLFCLLALVPWPGSVEAIDSPTGPHLDRIIEGEPVTDSPDSIYLFDSEPNTADIECRFLRVASGEKLKKVFPKAIECLMLINDNQEAAKYLAGVAQAYIFGAEKNIIHFPTFAEKFERPGRACE